jgi:diaminopimelate decarboxylase
MSSNYNGLTKPAVVLVNNGKSGLIVKRETYADIVKNDTMPEWF